MRVFLTGDYSSFLALGGHDRAIGIFKATTHGNVAIVDLELWGWCDRARPVRKEVKPCDNFMKT